MKPSVGIVIPSYNHAAYIESCILSALQQQHSSISLSVLVIDDASTDESPELIEKLSKEYGFTFLKNTHNQGVVKNLNTAINTLDCDYISILGSDDILLPNKTWTQVKFMEENKTVGVVSANSLRIDSYGNPLANKHQRMFKEATYNFEDVLMRKHRISTTAALIRTSVWKEVGGFSEAYKIEDLDLWLKITNKGFQISHLNKTLAQYRIHDTNTSKRVAFMYHECAKILAQYATHPNYAKSIKQLKRVYFPQLALAEKKLAIQILPEAIQWHRFFARGLKNLITF